MTFQSALITGGAGFIGSHLSEHLLSQGVAVTVIDNLSTGSWHNIEHLKARREFRAVIESADNAALLDREVPRHDVVYHLASAVGVQLIIERPVHTVQCIFNTTDAVLKHCAKYRRPVVLTSTSEVYGKSDRLPFSEDDDVVTGATSKRRWAYGCAKALDEFLALAHYYETSLPVHVVRLFNTVGPRQSGRYGMVLPRFVEQALSGKPITIFGDGEQRRCFAHVKDIVRALVRLPEVPQSAGRVINLGSQQEVSIRELAERVKSTCNSASEVVHVSYEQAYGAGFDDMRRRVPDLTRARKYLQWSPEAGLDEIISSVADHHRSRLT